jgi:hypothetical protein
LTDISQESTVTSPVKGIDIGKAVLCRLPDILNGGMLARTLDGMFGIDSGEIENTFGDELSNAPFAAVGISTTNSDSACNAFLKDPLEK